MKSNRSWDENSQATLTCDFPFSDVAESLADQDAHEWTPNKLIEEAADEFGEVERWMFEPIIGLKDATITASEKKTGEFLLRAMVCCWKFVPELSCQYSASQMAARFGADKEKFSAQLRLFPKYIKLSPAALEQFRKICSWIYQAPCKDLNGFFCRCAISIWIFIPELRVETLTNVAGSFGKKKQSLGRWVDDFKLQFPEITNHMQHIRNHE